MRAASDRAHPESGRCGSPGAAPVPQSWASPSWVQPAPRPAWRREPEAPRASPRPRFALLGLSTTGVRYILAQPMSDLNALGDYLDAYRALRRAAENLGSDPFGALPGR